MCKFQTTINVHAIWHTKGALLGRYGDMSVPPSLPQKKKYMHVNCSGPEIESGGFWHSYMYMYMSDLTKFWEGGSLVPRLSVQLFFAHSKISGQRAWYISSRELRWLRDVGCVVFLNRITRDIYEQRRLYVAAMRSKVRRPYQRLKTALLFEETEC